METLLLTLKTSIILVFIFFFIKGCKDGYLMECILIASVYPILATMIDQESGKVLILFVLYFIILILSLNKTKRKRGGSENSRKLFNVVNFCLFLWFGVSIITSPAIGYDYFNTKVTFSIIQIFIPLFLIIFTHSRMSKVNLEFLFKFFEVLSLISAIMLLVNAQMIGFRQILNSEFMTRVSVGEANVIWIGRFISIGFLLVLLRKKQVVTKLLKIGLLLGAMILTGSKAVLIFPVFTILGFILFLSVKSSKYSGNIKSISYLSLIILGIIFAISQLNPDAVERRFSLNSGTIDIRESTISNVWSHFLIGGNFFSGNGMATSGYPIVRNYNEISYPHNFTVEILYELGLIGFILFHLSLIIALGYYSRMRHQKDNKISLVVAITVMFFLFAQTSGNFTANSFIFILPAYLLASSQNFKGEEENVWRDYKYNLG